MTRMTPLSKQTKAFTVTVRSVEETGALAAVLAAELHPGDILCLSGDLGAGKTTFTRALVDALGSPAPVSSPTFTLIHEYAGGRLPVVHMDAYRLTGAVDTESIGLEEYLARQDSVLVIEWWERIADALPPERLEVLLEETGDEERRITCTGRGERWAAWKGIASC
jgi:tRNA threonylcarbamoyladenosine biosynthesis protein TsaE